MLFTNFAFLKHEVVYLQTLHSWNMKLFSYNEKIKIFAIKFSFTQNLTNYKLEERHRRRKLQQFQKSNNRAGQIYLYASNFSGAQFYLRARSGAQNQCQCARLIEKQPETVIFILLPK